MSSNRTTNEGITEKSFSPEEIKEFCFVEKSPPPPPPPNYPRKARSTSKLNFFNKVQEDKQGRTSAHVVNKVKKIDPRNNRNLYFFKKNEPGSPISELEALNCAYAQYLAGDDKVPSAIAYYDENDGFKFVGLASKAIPGFKSNHDDPLKEKDTVIEFIAQVIEKESKNNLFFELIDELIKHYQNKSARNSYINNWTNYYFNKSCTAVKVQEELIQFRNSPNKFSHEAIYAILESLQRRYVHKKDESDSEYQAEMDLISQVMRNAELLLDAGINANKPLEEMDKLCKLKGIDLATIEENKKIEAKIDGIDYAIKVKDLINYRIIKRLTTSLVVRFLMQDTDGHNQNMSKDGWLIDWDMAKLKISFSLRNPSVFDEKLRKPEKDTFVITADDIQNFPDIKDAKFFYWPTSQSFTGQSSMAEGVSWFYKIGENFFTLEDNKVFKRLALNPVCIFHKFKTFMKYKLSSKELFRRIGELHIRRDATYVDNNKVKNILTEVLDDEVARMHKVKTVLLSMPAYKRFFANQGDYVLQLIDEELKVYEDKYIKKLPDKPFYKNLTTAVRKMRIGMSMGMGR